MKALAIAETIVLAPLAKTVDNKYQAGEIDWLTVDEMAQSLADNRDNGMKGLHQVPEARPLPDGRYELAFARHRRAAFVKLAEKDPFWNEIPLIVREMDDLQMFEALAVENLKRRDINPMEKSEMYRTYMNVFGKNSREAAQFFDTSEEDIRGTVRFGNLHPVAQELLRSGELTVTDARVALGAQKVLSPQWQEQALEDVKNHTFDSPTVAFRNALGTDMNVVQFGGQASDWQDLNGKKFPVKYLPGLQRKQIAEILDVQNSDKARKQLLDQLMQVIESGMEIVDEQFPAFFNQLEKVRILVNPPACTGCPLHVSMNGSHYCGQKLCFDRKSHAWQQAEIVRQAKQLKISLYVNEATDGKALELTRYNEEDRKLFASRHADLRLKPTARTVWNNFDGVPNNLLVVVVGKTAEKRLKKQEEEVKQKISAEEKDDRESERREREQEAKAITIESLRRFHWEVVSPAFASALEGITSLPLLRFLLDEMLNFNRDAELPDGTNDEDELVESASTEMKKADGLRMLRRLIMHHTLYHRQEVRTLNEKKPIVAFAKACQEVADEWGVKLGRTWLTQAEKHQAELDAALKELTKKTKEAA